MSNKFLALLMLLSIQAIVLSGGFNPAMGATITVTNLNDSGAGSLRQAIADAAAGDTIDFSVTGTITLTSGPLLVANLTITGPGASHLTISGGGASRVFEVWEGTVAIAGLTISDGVVDGTGGGILLYGLTTLDLLNCVVTNNQANYGGGIAVSNCGTLNLSDSTISNNSALDGAGLRIMSSVPPSVANVTGSTFSGNQASNSGGGITMQGHLTLTNSTISGNSAAVFGAGLTVLSGDATLQSVTIASNIAPNQILQYAGATITARNSIIAGPSAGAKNCVNGGSPLISNGYNLDSGNTCGFNGTGDLINTDPLLGSLADNGGPTQTMALLTGSPAIDAGDPNNALTTDQRGITRPQGAAPDIGAYEYNPGDSTPAAFSFKDKTNAAINTFVAPDQITVSGITVPVSISISACTSTLCQYAVNGGAWTSASGTVNNNDSVNVRQMSSGSYSDITDLTLNIGGVQDTFSVSTVPPVSIIVTSPNGGETWAAGSTQTIHWTYTGNPGAYVKIELLKGGVLNKTIASYVSKGTGGAGSKTWTIPATQTPGADYTVRVTSMSNAAYSDTSDATFTITSPPPPSITVTSPNGGESWAAGSTHTITWTYAGNPGAYVKIELLKGGVINKTIASYVSKGTGGGSKTWTIPATQTPGADYSVRVTSMSNAACSDTSNAAFTITSPPPPSITVTSPNGGEVWSAGSTHTITWTYAGNPGAYVKIELLKGGVLNRLITSFASIGSGGAGSKSWTIPSTQTHGSDYTIRITSATNSSYTDTSDTNFTIQ